MILSKIRKLKDLQDQYAHDLAIARQYGESLEDPQERLSLLAYFDLHSKIITAINEYATIMDDSPLASAQVAILLEALAGDICGILASQNQALAGKTMQEGEIQRMKNFHKEIKSNE
jgi:hypothetical protein